MTDGTLLITANNTAIGVRFGMQSILAITTEGLLGTNENLGESDAAFYTASSITKMAYHGYLNWCLWMDTVPNLGRKEFIDFLDSAFLENQSIYNDIVEAFQNSKSIKGLSDVEKKTVRKKK